MKLIFLLLIILIFPQASAWHCKKADLYLVGGSRTNTSHQLKEFFYFKSFEEVFYKENAGYRLSETFFQRLKELKEFSFEKRQIPPDSFRTKVEITSLCKLNGYPQPERCLVYYNSLPQIHPFPLSEIYVAGYRGDDHWSVPIPWCQKKRTLN